MAPEYLWALAGVACIVALLVTIRIGSRNAEEFGDPADTGTAEEAR